MCCVIVSVPYGLETLFWISLRLFENFFHTTRLRIEYFLYEYLYFIWLLLTFSGCFLSNKLLLKSADTVCLFTCRWNVSTPYFYGNRSFLQTYSCYCETIHYHEMFFLNLYLSRYCCLSFALPTDLIFGQWGVEQVRAVSCAGLD